MADAVLYVRDLARMRAFYAGALAMDEVWSDGDACVLARGDGELSLVTVPARVHADLPALGDPPVRRSDTPIKLAFAVEGIEAARTRVEAGGGRADHDDVVWSFRGWRHLDVLDPEGNVLQLREPADGAP